VAVALGCGKMLAVQDAINRVFLDLSDIGLELFNVRGIAHVADGNAQQFLQGDEKTNVLRPDDFILIFHYPSLFFNDQSKNWARSRDPAKPSAFKNKGIVLRKCYFKRFTANRVLTGARFGVEGKGKVG
jgi:hypothetical protein